ncbi:MAG: LacI family DNA-binding transcriptional regulator [Oscillospiraceae bacterium]|nr:LacI family DNA-binding transcriptional regulator [Oscillospiraceae bacterium]
MVRVAELISSALKWLAASGYGVSLMTDSQTNVAGVLAVMANETELDGLNVPCVCLGSEAREYSCVTFDAVDYTYSVTKSLYEAGYKQVLLVHHGAKKDAPQELNGFFCARLELALDSRAEAVVNAKDIEEKLPRLLKKARPCGLILTDTADYSMVCRVLRLCGLKLDEVQVVVCACNGERRYLSPAPICYEYPAERMAQAAVSMLEEAIQLGHYALPDKRSVPGKFINRKIM